MTDQILPIPPKPTSVWEEWAEQVRDWDKKGRKAEFPTPPNNPPKERVKLHNLPLNDIDKGLEGVAFGEADLYETTFHNSNLRNTSFIETLGLTLSSFMGADLTAALVVESHSESDIKTVNDATRHANRTLATLLIGCLYVLLTVGSTTDIDLVLNEATFRMPFVGVEVDVGHFYFWAPPLLLGVFFYFHLYLQKIYQVMGRLPARLPDGRALDDVVDPWLFNSLARILNKTAASSGKLLDRLTILIVGSIGWLLIPITLIVVWGRYLTKHDAASSSLHTGFVAVGLAGTMYSWLVTKDRVRRTTHHERNVLLAATVLLATAAIFAGLTTIPFYSSRNSVASKGLYFCNTHPFAELDGAQFTKRHSSFPGDTLQSVRYEPPGLTGSNLRYASLRRAYLEHAVLNETDLSGADLSFANLNSADLREANLVGALIWGTSFEGSNLWEADLKGANPYILAEEGEISAYNYGGFYFKGAILFGADLRGLNLPRADFEGAELGGAHLQGVNMRLANLNGARLWNSSLYGADLKDADLRNATITGADLRGAKLWAANLLGADLIGAYLNGVDLRHARIGHIIDRQDVQTLTPLPSQLRYCVLDSTTKPDSSWIDALNSEGKSYEDLLIYSQSRIDSIRAIRAGVSYSLVAWEIDMGKHHHLNDTSWVNQVMCEE